MVVRGGHGWRLARGRRRRWCPERRTVPAGPSPCELAREVDGKSTEAMGICIVVVGVTSGPPAGLLFDEGVRPQGRVGSSQRGVRGGGSVEVQDRSPLRGRADGKGRAARAGARRDRGQQGV